MFKWFVRILALVAITASWAGCSSDSTAQGISPEAQFVPLYSGDASQSNVTRFKATKILTSQQQFATEFAAYVGTTPPTPDFTTGKVVLLDMGARSAGGYSITLTSVDVATNSVTANVDLVVPGSNCVVTQAITQPFRFVYIPTRKEILLSEHLTATPCP